MHRSKLLTWLTVVWPQNVSVTQYVTLLSRNVKLYHTQIRFFHQHVTNYGKEKVSAMNAFEAVCIRTPKLSGVSSIGPKTFGGKSGRRRLLFACQDDHESGIRSYCWSRQWFRRPLQRATGKFQQRTGCHHRLLWQVDFQVAFDFFWDTGPFYQWVPTWIIIFSKYKKSSRGVWNIIRRSWRRR